MRLRRALSKLALLCLCVLLMGTASAFSDVPAGSWYEGAVAEMERTGLLSGYPDGSFGPGDPVSAAQFVSITARCAGLEPVPGQSAHWASGALQAALQAGWYDWDEIPPTGETFDRPIPRQLAVKILMRALLPQVQGDYMTGSQKIRDFSQLDGRYYGPVLAAYAAGILHGDSAGNFSPKSSLSRAETCILFQKALALTGAGRPAVQPDDLLPQPEVPQPAVTVQEGVSANGWLQVIGTQLCNERGEPVVLRGMSSHGLQWYGQFAGTQPIRNTADLGADLFRVAMYTGEGGYLSDPAGMEQKAAAAVDAAIANDMYVILDWHILSDGDPMAHLAEAETFFDRMARRYRDCPAVLYEICNEPNGNVTWEGNVKPYAQRIVERIRAQSPRSVILIGSPTWSQDIHLAAQSPVEGTDLMYTLHFYAGTHGAELRQRIDSALSAGLPIFVSEWGTSRADGSGGVFLEESAVWLDFLAQRGISWANWSLCDKGETSAALRPGTPAGRPWTWEELTESGQFVFSRFSDPT